MDNKRIVVALGRNAFGKTFPEQQQNVKKAAVAIADLKDYTVGDGNGDGRLPGWCRYFSVWNSEKSSFQR